MYTAKRKELIDICRLTYDRYLTNAAGANFSARASETTLFMTPTGNSKRNRLRMSPDDLLLVDFDGSILEGVGELSVSWPTHVRMYKEFDFIGAVIHAHPRYATVFSCREQPMPPLLDAMKKYGPIDNLPRELEVDSPGFGDAIVEEMRKHLEGLRKHGHSVLYPYHGVLAVAPDLDNAYDLIERMEFNATALIFSKLLDFEAENG